MKKLKFIVLLIFLSGILLNFSSCMVVPVHNNGKHNGWNKKHVKRPYQRTRTVYVVEQDYHKQPKMKIYKNSKHKSPKSKRSNKNHWDAKKQKNMKNNNTDYRHITVTGFIGDKKDTPAKKISAGQVKLKAAGRNITDAKKDFDEAFNLAVKEFKVDASNKITQTETKILELKDKISNTSNEIGHIYQDQIDKLEYSNKLLMSRLDEYKEIGAEDWKTFKHQFNKEVESFESSVANFIEKLKTKEKSEDKGSKHNPPL